MSDSNLPSVSRSFGELTPATNGPPLVPSPAREPEPASEGLPWERYIAAIRRFKWLIAAVVIAGTAAGALVTKFIAPVYAVNAKVWVASESPERADRGPIRAAELLSSASWTELLRSGRVLDPVVRKLQLYLLPESRGDSLLYTSFSPGDRMRPGQTSCASIVRGPTTPCSSVRATSSNRAPWETRSVVPRGSRGSRRPRY
jgi:hypothetical protein